jgi:hypothetical protein
MWGLNANFFKGDQFLSLTYNAEAFNKLFGAVTGETEEERRAAIRAAAKHQFELWTKRVQWGCKKRGVTFKTAHVTSDMDGKTGDDARIHHHVCVNAAAAEFAIEKWTAGAVEQKKMTPNEDGGFLELARYMLEQVRYEKDEKKFSMSRNCEAVKGDLYYGCGGGHLKAPKGTRETYSSDYRPYTPQVIRYRYIPEWARPSERRIS